MSIYEQKKISTLPAKDYIIDWFVQRIPIRRGGIPMIKTDSPSDRILILRSGTGSGKSTTLAPELYLRFKDAMGKNIAVTQPRIMTAIGVTKDIVQFYPDIKMGDNIGYQTSMYTYKPKKGIIFMTVGTLTQQLKIMSDEEFMRNYSFVIIDECHERSTEMDLALSLTKQLVHRNYKHSSCPFLIITSATFDVLKYSKYFETDPKQIIDVEGINYPIKTVFTEIDVGNVVTAAVNTVLDIHKNTDDYKSRFTDILIFVYGGTPSQEIINELENANISLTGNHFVPIKLSGLTFMKGDINYQNIFKPLHSINVVLKNKKIVVPNRRIIVSTNVAETGVTIDTLKYVIDTGYENFAMFNPVYGVYGLVPKAITQASAVQRKGRVGRRAPGEWYPLYTNKTFKKLSLTKFPDIISEDISSFMLSIIIKSVYPNWDGIVSPNVDINGKFDISELDLLDFPAVDSIQNALEKLFVLGFIDHNYIPTVMGLAYATVTYIDVESIRMIFAGYQNGANILDLITIASFMNIRKQDYVDRRSKKKYNYANLFKRSEKELRYYDQLLIADDFIQTVFIWNDFQEQIDIMRKKLSINHMKKWCKDNGLLYKGMLQVIERRDELIAIFIQSMGLNPFHNGLNLKPYNIHSVFTDIKTGLDEIRKLKECIYEGFRLNVCTWNEKNKSYIVDSTHTQIKVYSDVIKALPDHISFKQKRPKKICVRDLRMEENKYNGLYQFTASRVSVLDGYVNVDDTFILS